MQNRFTLRSPRSIVVACYDAGNPAWQLYDSRILSKINVPADVKIDFF